MKKRASSSTQGRELRLIVQEKLEESQGLEWIQQRMADSKGQRKTIEIGGVSFVFQFIPPMYSSSQRQLQQCAFLIRGVSRPLKTIFSDVIATSLGCSLISNSSKAYETMGYSEKNHKFE